MDCWKARRRYAEVDFETAFWELHLEHALEKEFLERKYLPSPHPVVNTIPRDVL